MRYLAIPLISLLFLFTVIPLCYAGDDDIDLAGMKTHLAEKFHIDEFSAGLLLTAFVYMMFILPIVVYSRKMLPSLTIGLLILGFCVAIGWTPYFILILLILLIGGLWTKEIKEALT